MTETPPIPTEMPSPVNIEYTCSHCGHVWTENHSGATETVSQLIQNCAVCQPKKEVP